MALALGVNVSYALSAGSSGCTSNSGTLSICAQNGTTTTPNGGDQSTNLGITWQGVNSGTSAYMPALSGGNTIIENLNFNFNSNGNPIAQGSNSGNTLNINVNKNSNIVVLMKGNTKGLQLGASGTGTMTIDFGSGADTARDFTLDLNDTANGDFSYKGNLVVKAGKGYGDSGSSVFNGYFNKKFIGNIVLGYTGGGNAGWAKNNLTLSGGIQGNINTSAGTNTITITGDLNGGLTASAANGGFATANNTITFTQNGSITGRIYTNGGISNVKFGANTGTITGNIDNNYGTLNLTATGNTGIIDLQDITIGTTGQATARNNITASTINSSNVTLNIGGVSISNNKNGLRIS